jgi:putative ABC transport system permease protein
MSTERLVDLSERWFRLLHRLYPADFRDDMGTALVEAYRDRAREALARGGIVKLAALWIRALVDSVRNGPGERTRPAVAWRRAGNWGRDAELATRRLVRAPALTLAMVGTLTVGLGLFAVVYAVVHKILIAPMPYKDAGGLYFAWRDYGRIFDLNRGWLSGPDIAELQKAGGVIEAVAGLGRQLATFSPREGSDPTEISIIIATPNLFDVLGVQPTLGRGFAASEGGPKRPPVIVLTHDLWNRLGADPAILGTDVRVNGQSFTVIGVTAPGFTFARNASLGPPQRAEAFITFENNLAELNPKGGSFAGLLRARQGAGPGEVGEAVAAVGRTVDRRDFNSGGLKLYSVGLKADLVATIRPVLIVLGFAGLLLVLVLMVNLASVLLARAAQREREFAVSRALGANSAAIVRASLLEGGVLGLTGGVLAAIAAVWGTRALVALAPLDLPRRESIGVDWTIGATIASIGVLLGLIAAIPPALWAARSTLSTLLANTAVRGGGGHGRMRRALVVGQVALCLVLLTTGGLVVRSFERLLRADPGFRPDGLLAVRVPIPSLFVREMPDAIILQDRIEQAFAALPGVTGVTATSAIPLAASAGQQTITFPGAPGISGDASRDNPLVDVIGARARFVEVMGVRLTSGRGFDAARREGVREVMIDQQLARQFFPTGNPLGASIPYGPKGEQPLTVVGVIEQARLYDVHQDGRPQVLVRAEDWGYRTLNFMLRTGRDPRSLVPDARAAVRGIDARLALADIRTMDEVVDNALRRQRISAVLISAFACGALLLAAMGLFGIVAGSVTRRRHELALRLAIGADHRRLLRLVLGEGAMLVAIGLLIGLPAIYAAGRLMRGVLVGVSPLDPPTLLAVAAGLIAVTMLACYLPARRVLAIDPAQALRQE